MPPKANATHALAPGLLLAAPQLGDPNFDHTVVLLGHHDADGALGWVLNGRAIAPTGELLTASNLVPEGVTLPATPAFSRHARVGGPVSPATGWLVYRGNRDVDVREIALGDDFAATSDAKALELVTRGALGDDFVLLLGYAGWGPGQLEDEIRDGAWLPAALDATLVLSTSIDDLWARAYERAIGFGAGAFTPKGGGTA